MDGGWLTAEGLAMEVEMNAKSVLRSLWRWLQAGHVESRRVELAYIEGVNVSGRNRSHTEVRREWKTT